MNIPTIISYHLADHAIQSLQAAWIKVEKNGVSVLDVGGAWMHYFEEMPTLGHDVSQLCDALLGMFPLVENFNLPEMQLTEHQYTNIIGISDETFDWLLLCDVTKQTQQLQRYQQASNELVLLQGQLNRTLARYVGTEVVKRDADGILSAHAKAERRMVTTLFTDIRSFTPFNEKYDAQIVMETLNEYMDCMLNPILDEAGMIDKITGDGAMAIFGVLASTQGHTHHAFLAAKNILHHTAKLNQQRTLEGLETLGVSVGIATGEAVLGMLGTHNRRCFTAIGPHVNRAARLESHALAGEILLDQESYEALRQPAGFSSRLPH
ncbi:MAG: adenylate/guanylate cyclase domain-containing protein, partial [Mariprofundaceae bacterium]|nr:adenylate/guanylate cyclase domain-containing protein [Mariprofundaceae bacterium]